MKAGDQTILHHRNRSFAEGRTGRLPLHDCAVGAFATVGCLCVSVFMAFVFLSGDLGSVWYVLGGALMVLLSLGFAVLFAVGTVPVFRDRARLQSHGRLLTGEVTKTEEDSDWVYTGQGGFVPVRGIRIVYRFLTPAGDERTGDVWMGGEHDSTHWSGGHRPLPRQG